MDGDFASGGADQLSPYSVSGVRSIDGGAVRAYDVAQELDDRNGDVVGDAQRHPGPKATVRQR